MPRTLFRIMSYKPLFLPKFKFRHLLPLRLLTTRKIGYSPFVRQPICPTTRLSDSPFVRQPVCPTTYLFTHFQVEYFLDFSHTGRHRYSVILCGEILKKNLVTIFDSLFNFKNRKNTITKFFNY